MPLFIGAYVYQVKNLSFMMKTCIYWWLCVLLVASCQSKTDQPSNNNVSQNKPAKTKEIQEDEQPEYVKAITQQKMKATLQDYCEKLSNESYEAAIRDNFAPKVGQYIGMRDVTADQIATEVNRFLSQKKQVSYQVALDKLKVNGYLATVPLSFSWEGYYAKVLLELSFDANYKIAFYKEAKVVDKAVVQFVQRKIFEGENGCTDRDDDCTYYALEYPEIIQAPAYLKDKLPKKPEKYGFMDIYSGNSPKQVLDSLVKHYTIATEGEYRSGKWFVDDRTILKESKYMVSVESVMAWYVGQAYPEAFVNINHYDKYTGKKISLEDLLINDALEDFEEVAFQTIVGEQNQGCRDGFMLSSNFRILEKGIQLCYSRAIGSQGPCFLRSSEFLIPYEKFKYIIRKDGLLRDKIR